MQKDSILSCGAKKRNGEPCRNPPVTGSKRCRMHGGKSASGIASPRFENGRYSKHLPSRMAARYLESRDDQELLTLREEVALLDARIGDLLARVDTGESGRIWKDTSAAFYELRDANTSGDKAAATKAFRELDALIARGRSDYGAWEEVISLVEQRRRTVDSERKHLQQMGQLVAVEQMMVLASALLAAVKQHVTDREQLRLITTEFTRLTEVS